MLFLKEKTAADGDGAHPGRFRAPHGTPNRRMTSLFANRSMSETRGWTKNAKRVAVARGPRDVFRIWRNDGGGDTTATEC